MSVPHKEREIHEMMKDKREERIVSNGGVQISVQNLRWWLNNGGCNVVGDEL